jgi:hypothetical protein
LKNKYFLAFLTILAVAIGVVWLVNNNSLEARCRRKYQSYGSLLMPNSNGLQQQQLKTAMEPLVEKCIKNGEN